MAAPLGSRVEHEEVPKVSSPSGTLVRRGDGPPDAAKAQCEIDRLLAEDNADGLVFEDGGDRPVIAFPGVKRPPPEISCRFRPEEGLADGLLIDIGGADQTVHVELQNGDVNMSASRPIASIGAECGGTHLEPIRVSGVGHGCTDAHGQWALKRFAGQA